MFRNNRYDCVILCAAPNDDSAGDLLVELQKSGDDDLSVVAVETSNGKVWVNGSQGATHSIEAQLAPSGRALFVPDTTNQLIEFSADGTRLVTASWDMTAKLWDAATGQELRTFAGHEDKVSGAALSADGRKLLIGRSAEAALFDLSEWLPAGE